MGNILTLAGEFKELNELQIYCDKQYVALKKAAEKIAQQEQELIHLKDMLSAATPLFSKIEKHIITPEEAICARQIELLQDRALTKELTLEEVKKLDLLIKNLRLVKDQATTIPGNSRPINPGLGKSELVKLASQLPPEENV